MGGREGKSLFLRYFLALVKLIFISLFFSKQLDWLSRTFERFISPRLISCACALWSRCIHRIIWIFLHHLLLANQTTWIMGRNRFVMSFEHSHRLTSIALISLQLYSSVLISMAVCVCADKIFITFLPTENMIVANITYEFASTHSTSLVVVLCNSSMYVCMST